MNRRELELLIQQALDGDLVSSDLERLEQELLANQEARAVYRKYAILHSSLETAHSLNSNTVDEAVVPIDKVIRLQKAKAWRVAMMSAAAIFIIALIAMRLFFVAEKEPGLVFKTSPGTQFNITHSGAGESPKGMVMENGSRLQLSQGTVELTFESGVKSIVMAPADLTLHDDDTLFLNKGTAWFQVPKGAEGFEVITKDLTIVDLGTEFGVIAKPDTHHEVHVLKGRVQVTAKRVRKESAELVAGEARRTDPVGRLSPIPTKATAFLTSLPQSLPYIHWSFDGENGIQATGSHPAVADIATTANTGPNFSSGKHGKALSLGGASQYLTTNWPGFEGNRPRTVSFWIKLPSHGDYSKFPGIVGWGDRTGGTAHKWKVMVVNRAKATPAYLRLSWGNVWLTSRTPIPASEWHHVTVTSNGRVNKAGYPEAELYIDGQKLNTHYGKQIKNHKELTYATSVKTLNATPLIIGSDLFPNPKNRNFFNGEIDELYIFDGHMTEDEVLKSYHR